MNPIRLRIEGPSPAEVEAELARYLPGLDVQLFAYREASVLLPPHLLLALGREYGSASVPSVLAKTGLVRGETVPWRDVIAWARDHPEAWSQHHGVAQPEAAADAAWHLRICQVPQAWNVLGGVDRIAWGDVRVGLVDTGYTRHPVFGFPAAPWVDVERARTFVDDASPGGGLDPLGGASGGHGTGSGSVIAGMAQNAPYFGAAPRVPLVPARINDCIVIDQRADEFEAAVRYLVDSAGVGVINVSMGTFLTSAAPRPMQRALDHCYERGVIVIGAAGNVPAPDWPAYPAALPRAIAVAGVTRKARPWSLSSYGRRVDFSAPAKAVHRAATAEGPAYGYAANFGGTTFAAAMTSAAAALWLVAHRDALPRRYPQAWQRIEAFRLMSRRTAIVPPGWVPDGGFGSGILNVLGLMNPGALPEPAELAQRGGA